MHTDVSISSSAHHDLWTTELVLQGVRVVEPTCASQRDWNQRLCSLVGLLDGGCTARSSTHPAEMLLLQLL